MTGPSKRPAKRRYPRPLGEAAMREYRLKQIEIAGAAVRREEPTCMEAYQLLRQAWVAYRRHLARLPAAPAGDASPEAADQEG